MALLLAKVSNTLNILVNSGTTLKSLTTLHSHQPPVLNTLQVCAFDLVLPA